MNNIKNIFEYIGQRSYKEAIEGIDKALITEPNKAYYFYLQGYCFYRLGNFFRTISLCKQALEGGVKAEECYLLIGQSYECMEWFEESKRNFLIGLKLNPNNSEIKAAYAYLLLKNGYINEAYSFIVEAIKAHSKNCIVNHYVVYFYIHKKSFKFEKYDLIKEFVENSPNEIFKYIRAGKLDIKKKRYRSAMNNFEKAYLLDSENEAIADLLDELRLKIKVIYKPLLIVDVVGGWSGWSKILVMIALVTVVSLIIQTDGLLNIIFILIFAMWILIGAIKFISDLFYWEFYSWE